MGPRDKKRQNSLKNKKIARSYKESSDKDYSYNYLITLQYDGFDFGGYAKQKHKNTIQNNLEDVLEKVLFEKVKTTESSRTDAKVHALCQKVMFKYHKELDVVRMKTQINELIKDGINVIDIFRVDTDFHCRYDVKKKVYQYTINSEYSIFHRKYEYYYNKQLDIKAMKKACKYLEGEHDFTSFCSTKSTQESKVRTIYSIVISKYDTCISIEVCGSGFLYNMVRIIVGTLIEVGEHKRSIESVKECLESKSRLCAGETAPAHGLLLKDIIY